MNTVATPGTTITIEYEHTTDSQTTLKTLFEQNHHRNIRFTLRISPLWVCMLIALALRVWLIVRTHGVIDGDEAMVGIQAEHILRGEHPLPLYFYGQPYMGSLEAYLVAILFKIAGPSVWALRAEPTLLSLVVVWLTGKMAKALAHAAQLPLRATQLFMTTAMLFAAISPVYDTVLELHTLGGYIETFILMLFLLLSAFQLTQRWHEGASRKELAWRWAGIGFVSGLGLWVDPLIASAIVTATLWIVGYCVSEVVRKKNWWGSWNGAIPSTYGQSHSVDGRPHIEDGRPQGASPHVRTTPVPTMYDSVPAKRANLRHIVGTGAGWMRGGAPCGRPSSTCHASSLTGITALPAFFLGASPAILWGMRYKWANVTYLLQIGNQPQNLTFQQQYPTRLDVVRGMLQFYSNVMTPRLVGGALPGEDGISPALHTGTTIIGLLFVLATTALVICSFFSRRPQLRLVRHLAALPLLFALCSTAIFCTSPIASAALLSPQYDLAGRYATPLMLVLPFFFATTITVAMMWVHVRGGRDKSVPTVVFNGSGRDKSVPTHIAQGILFVLLLLTLGMQSASYGMVDPAATFQSPSCPIAPANDGPIIAYLQQEHVHYAWAVPWIGNPITFKTNDGIITADPRPIINFSGVTRINAYLQDVSLAHQPAILTFVLHNDPYPLLLWILDTRHISYRATYFPSEPGIDIMVVTRLSRSLSLYTSKYLRDVFSNCI